MLRIAVTGGIATGKSCVTDYLKILGYEVIDADEISHSMTAPGGKAIPYIIECFGKEYLLPDGGLDRRRMRELVFNDPEKLRLLEKGTTDIIAEEMKLIMDEKDKLGLNVVFAAVPLLFEKNLQGDYNFIWIVTTENDIRIERLCKRDNISREEACKIIGNQIPEEQKISMSDEVIDNSGTFEEMYSKIKSLLKKYDLQLCK